MSQKLRFLRSKGVLVVGSGNIVHNLRYAGMSGEDYDWAIEFDNKAIELLNKEDFQSLVLKYFEFK